MLNRSLKQGRVGVQRAQPRNPEDILPPIQVEPGQTPWGILEEYFKREGFLLNVGAQGDLIVFQPDYFQPSLYPSIEYHGSTDARHKLNNVQGRPTLKLALDGLYSEFQCWSTVVVPDEAQQAAIAQNPNAQYRHTSYKPSTNPLPFYRLQAVVDSEAISPQMRTNRAVFGYQMGQFDSTIYECSVAGHSTKADKDSPGVFWTADTMVSVHDSVNGPTSGTFYIQRVERSWTLEGGAVSKLTCRLPVLNPSLQAQIGGGAKKIVAGGSTTEILANGESLVIPKAQS